MADYRLLTESEIDDALTALPGWKFVNPNISATFTFDSFRLAMCFIGGVGLVAEKLNHHPEFCVSYNKVSFSYCTHDVGFKITDVDVSTARELTDLARSIGGRIE
jgi:4a-hydroxytetrahydrobiopterin dehydratase